jgi:nucleotide sugar dehydrogenase
VTYLRGGVGFGGSCFPKDVKALQAFAADRGISTPVLSSVLTTNEERAGQIVNILAREMGDLLAKRIVILGLAFKPDTDDIRESPGLKIGRELLKQRAKVVVHDPIVPKSAALQALGQRVEYAEDAESAFIDSDAVVIATAWNHYRNLDWVAATKRMRSPVILDGRQILNSNMVPANVKYLTIGRRGAAVQQGRTP